MLFSLCGGVSAQDANSIQLELQRRHADGTPYQADLTIDPQKCAIVVVDMWDSHSSWDMAKRSEALIPRMNQVFDIARSLGMKIIFIPSEFSDRYSGTPQRDLVKKMPKHILPAKVRINFPSPVSSDNNMEPRGINVPYTAAHGEYGQNPDLIIRSADYVADWQSEQELYNITQEKGITHLFYTGCATNMCVINRPFGMENMTCYGFPCVVIRDLTEALTKVTNNYCPDDGTRFSVEYIEQYVGSSIHSMQLTKYSPAHRYSNQILREPGLLCYWRMSGKAHYQVLLDLLTNQGAWRDDAKIVGGSPGITDQDSDKACFFPGNSAFVIGPSWWNKGESVWSKHPTLRDAILTDNSPLLHVSEGSFSVEAWVQIADLSSTPQWILTHDDGEKLIDFMLGIGQDSCFHFITRNENNHLVSKIKLGPSDVHQHRWYHLVGIQDALAGLLALYVNGEKQSEGGLRGEPVDVLSTLQMGSRGMVFLDQNTEGVAYIFESGKEFFNGTMDEVALYTKALDDDIIKSHYALNVASRIEEPLDGRTGCPVLEVYPNPFNAAVNIQIKQLSSADRATVQLEVYNILGEVVYHKRFEPNMLSTRVTWIPNGASSSGLYLIRVWSENNNWIKKVTYLK